MPSSQSTPETQSKPTNTLGESTGTRTDKKSSTYDAAFEQHLIDHKIYPSNYDFPDDRLPPKPSNWKEINDRLKVPRASLSPTRFTDGAFDKFVRANSRTANEATVMRRPFPIISGDTEIPSADDVVFVNLEPLTDGTIVDCKPDFYDGARPAQIDRRIRAELGLFITPSRQQHKPALPNFFAEAKGPDGSWAVGNRQACYDGVVGARGIHELRSFGANESMPLYDNNSYTITSTYSSGLLQLYTIHPTLSPGSEDLPEYHMTQLRSFAMTDTAERFREGATAFRNARDWAKDRRNEVIAAANDRLADMPTATTTTTSESSGENTSSRSTNGVVGPDSATSAEVQVVLAVSDASGLSYNRLKRGPGRINTPKPGPNKRGGGGGRARGRRRGTSMANTATSA